MGELVCLPKIILAAARQTARLWISKRNVALVSSSHLVDSFASDPSEGLGVVGVSAT